ncbi:hypothetical protein P8452_48023 [Trifolium repens]|nr:hypothetical protein P8452_48023 [Trifolium repens]
MVNATKGVFISCDIPMAQYIINMNASLPASDKFIIHILDKQFSKLYVQTLYVQLKWKKQIQIVKSKVFPLFDFREVCYCKLDSIYVQHEWIQDDVSILYYFLFVLNLPL